MPKNLAMKREYSKAFTFPTVILRLVLIFNLLITLNHSLFAREILFNDDEIFGNLIDNQFEEVMQSLQGNAKLEDIRALKNAKITLINGNIKEAKFHLNRINEEKSFLGAIKKRYQAIIFFIENDYPNAYNSLKQMETFRGGDNSELCLLKIITLMALNKNDELKKEEARCLLAQENYSPNEMFWLNSMLNLYSKNTSAIDRELSYNSQKFLVDDEISKLWLKINLYLNREKEAIELFTSLPENAYSSYKVRELIAFLYMRMKNYERAMNFIEDVDSVNAENIKGNIRIIDKAYELAFGHFKLALKKKSDSINALEKGIPLSWILGQWGDGIEMLKNVSSSQISDDRTKRALSAAFNIRLKNFKLAREELSYLRINFQNQPPSEILMMETYLALMEKNKKSIENSSEIACKSFDGMSCYISAQTISWNNLGLQIKEDSPIQNNQDFDIEKLKEDIPPQKIKEDIFVDQRDIEELDSVDAFKNGLGSP